MKAFTILPVAAAALFALTTAAYSQANCQNDYTACMTSCASKSMKSMQDACFGHCENNNNICSEKIFGKRPFNGAPSSVAEQKGAAKNALAKKTKQRTLSLSRSPKSRLRRRPRLLRSPRPRRPRPLRSALRRSARDGCLAEPKSVRSPAESGREARAKWGPPSARPSRFIPNHSLQRRTRRCTL